MPQWGHLRVWRCRIREVRQVAVLEAGKGRDEQMLRGRVLRVAMHPWIQLLGVLPVMLTNRGALICLVSPLLWKCPTLRRFSTTTLPATARICPGVKHA